MSETIESRVKRVYTQQFGEDCLNAHFEAEKGFLDMSSVPIGRQQVPKPDSLDKVEFVMALEEEFLVEIPDLVAEKFLNGRDAVEWLENRQNPDKNS